MRITKGDGAIYSLLLMSPYIIFYYFWTKNLSHSVELTFMFTVGMLLHFFRKIEPGTQAELLFFGKSTKYFWNDGFCLVPSVLPALHNIGIYLLWDLKKDVDISRQNTQSDVNIHHHRDQRKPEYKINTNATLFESTMYRLSESIGSWFFGLDDKNPELIYQKLGFRIVIIAIILGGIGNIFYKVETTLYPNPPSATENKILAPREQLEKTFPLLEVNKGECINISNGGYALIGTWSPPISITGIEDEFLVIGSDGVNYKMSLIEAVKYQPVFTTKQKFFVHTKNVGSLCF